jgi:hypothetical protein
MLFGMGMKLTEEEDAQLENVVHPCFAALGLANDYFSFDREYEEFKNSKATSLTNAVWLFMQWHDVDVHTAKDMVRTATNCYEKQFLELSKEFRRTHAPISEKLNQYLMALTYQVGGNVVWSLNCPRYHSGFRYDPNAGIEDFLTSRSFPKDMKDIPTDIELLRLQSMESGTGLPGASRNSRKSSSAESASSMAESISSMVHDDASSVSSVSSRQSTPEPDEPISMSPLKHVQLDPKVSTKERGRSDIDIVPQKIQAPFTYVESMPSKGLRDTFIDALNIWLDAPQENIPRIKWITSHLHTASLM